MCCLFTTLVFLGPHAGILIWWLLQPARWPAPLLLAATRFGDGLLTLQS